MEDFNKTIETFLQAVKSFTGAVPTFKIDYKKNKIIVVDAASGFVKIMVNIDGATTHLKEDGIHFELFKR